MNQLPGEVLSLVFGRLLTSREVGVLASQLLVFTLKLGDLAFVFSLIVLRDPHGLPGRSGQHRLLALVKLQPRAEVGDLALIVTPGLKGRKGFAMSLINRALLIILAAVIASLIVFTASTTVSGCPVE